MDNKTKQTSQAILIMLFRMLSRTSYGQMDGGLAETSTIKARSLHEEMQRPGFIETEANWTKKQNMWYVFAPSVVNAQKAITGAGSLGISQDRLEAMLGY